MRRCFLIHLNNKERSMQKNDKDRDFFLELGKYLVEINNCFQLLNYNIVIKYTEIRCPETLFVVHFMSWGL